MANRTIGIEIEMYVFVNGFEDYLMSIDDNPAAAYGSTSSRYQAIERVLNKIGCQGWQAKDDGSLQTEEINNEEVFGVEVITPPLTWDQVKTQIPKFFKTFMQFSTAEDESCGLHVHIDVSDLIRESSNEEIMNKLMMLMLQYKSAEPVFDKMVAAHRKENEYANSVGFKELVQRYSQAIFRLSNKGNLSDIIEALGEDRYAKLNILSLNKQPTVEFRQHEGTDDPRKILLWVSNCLNFINIFNTTEKVFENFLLEARKVIQQGQEHTFPGSDRKTILKNALQDVQTFLSSTIASDLNQMFLSAASRSLEVIPLRAYIKNELFSGKKRIEIDLSKLPKATFGTFLSDIEQYKNHRPTFRRMKYEFVNSNPPYPTAIIIYPYADKEWIKGLYKAEVREKIFSKYSGVATKAYPTYQVQNDLGNQAQGIVRDTKPITPIRQLQEAIKKILLDLK